MRGPVAFLAAPPAFSCPAVPRRPVMPCRFARVAAGAAVIAAISGSTAAAAQGSQSAPVNERPTPLTVDFSVVTADGSPVQDLQATEIEVRIGDRVRAVRALRRIVTAPIGPAGAVRLPAPYGTND